MIYGEICKFGVLYDRKLKSILASSLFIKSYFCVVVFRYIRGFPRDIIRIVSKGAKISRYIQVPHLTQNTNGKVTN